jgi:hypothetical protein
MRCSMSCTREQRLSKRPLVQKFAADRDRQKAASSRDLWMKAWIPSRVRRPSLFASIALKIRS